jgi:3-hydroxybutyryl-CoA dehydrogenase
VKRQARPLIDPHKHKPQDCKAGVVGLGLMGISITACLLAAGHPVAGLEKEAIRRQGVKGRVLAALKRLAKEGFLAGDPDVLIKNLTVSSSYSGFADAALVVESITESLNSKIEVLLQLEAVVSPGTLIGTNTSAIPITQIQKKMSYPGRALGMHWDEPAHVTIFMEIIQGELTSPAYFDLAAKIAEQWWGKEPSCVRKDIKGFITNRISYAMFREACHLVDSGVATIEDVDRSMRNDVGWWMGQVGPFRYMDLMGVRAYETVMRDLLPDLSCGKEIPQVMRRATKGGGNGSSNGKGFYRYTPTQAKRWEKRFLEFTYEIRRLTAKYAASDT